MVPLGVKAIEHKHPKQARTIFAVSEMQPFFTGQLRPFLGHFKDMFLNKVHIFLPLCPVCIPMATGRTAAK
jgi:hypothetical protein